MHFSAYFNAFLAIFIFSVLYSSYIILYLTYNFIKPCILDISGDKMLYIRREFSLAWVRARIACTALVNTNLEFDMQLPTSC